MNTRNLDSPRSGKELTNQMLNREEAGLPNMSLGNLNSNDEDSHREAEEQEADIEFNLPGIEQVDKEIDSWFDYTTVEKCRLEVVGDNTIHFLKTSFWLALISRLSIPLIYWLLPKYNILSHHGGISWMMICFTNLFYFKYLRKVTKKAPLFAVFVYFIDIVLSSFAYYPAFSSLGLLSILFLVFGLSDLILLAKFYQKKKYIYSTSLVLYTGLSTVIIIGALWMFKLLKKIEIYEMIYAVFLIGLGSFMSSYKVEIYSKMIKERVGGIGTSDCFLLSSIGNSLGCVKGFLEIVKQGLNCI